MFDCSSLRSKSLTVPSEAHERNVEGDVGSTAKRLTLVVWLRRIFEAVAVEAVALPWAYSMSNHLIVPSREHEMRFLSDVCGRNLTSKMFAVCPVARV